MQLEDEDDDDAALGDDEEDTADAGDEAQEAELLMGVIEERTGGGIETNGARGRVAGEVRRRARTVRQF